MVEFRRYNMLDEMTFSEAFDIIFCRNVLRFFTNDAQALIVNHIYHNQVPGGFLYLGVGERAVDLEKYYEPVKGLKCLYQAKVGVESRRLHADELKKAGTKEAEMPSFIRPDTLRPLASDILKK